ncbi:uncharacterized protein TNCV_3901631 [Trichonephila clavipes]|nr:uncharacterized protein TNCV_3901631 [Trichonephila clavipes]
MPKARSKVSRKRKFYGNRFTKLALNSNNSTSASEAKLSTFDSFHVPEPEFHGSTGNRIINFQALMETISILCCPECYATGLKLAEDSKEGLCSNLCVACSCGFMTGFTSTPKENKKFSLNTLLVFGLRLIGRGFTAGKKLLCTLNLPYISKNTFRAHELKLLEAVQLCSEENMKAASKEVQNLKKSTTCGVSVDGSWQRRGHMSLNGCVSVISIDTGKILDLEVMTQYCKMCELNVKREHVCSNYKGSSGNMEAVGAFRIFERSLIKRDLQYTEYYGDGDSKGFLQVKDIYGENSVTKLECIGHIQKRVGSRLRKLKKNTTGLGGKGKLTDKFIDKLQNYYGIAIRSNVGCLEKMQFAVIAAFFHCCSSNQNPMHGQCPTGKDSWCKYKQALSDGKVYVDKTAGLSNYVIKVIKPTYLALCDKELLYIKNASMARLKIIMKALIMYCGIGIDPTTLKNYMGIDKERIQKSKCQSLPSTKLSRKKQKAKKKSKLAKNEAKEGLSYKYGEV